METVLTGSRRAKRDQIAAAARRLFLDHGFAGTSMDAVTAAAGVSKQTLYRYYPTKVALLTDMLYGGLATLSPTPPDPDRVRTLDGLRASLVDFSVAFTGSLLQPEAVGLLRLVLGEAFRLPELRTALREAIPGQVLDRTEALIRRAVAKGLIATDDPALAARMLVGPLMSYVALDGFLGVTPVPPPSRAQLERLVDAFLAMVEVRR